MSNNITEEKIRQVLAKIKHPVIEQNLVKLGIIKDINFDTNILKILFAFPFVGKAAKDVSIRDQIIKSVLEELKKLQVKYELYQTEMNQDELRIFLATERESWDSIAS